MINNSQQQQPNQQQQPKTKDQNQKKKLTWTEAHLTDKGQQWQHHLQQQQQITATNSRIRPAKHPIARRSSEIQTACQVSCPQKQPQQQYITRTTHNQQIKELRWPKVEQQRPKLEQQ